jgi:DNA-binding response OmpR family regulator
MKDKIIVVEDNADIREIITLILSAEDFEVFESSPDTLQDDIKTIKPNLVILDYLLSHPMSGADLCKLIKTKEEHRHLPIILISAIADIAQISKICEATAFIGKPFNIADFVKTVNDTLIIC